MLSESMIEMQEQQIAGFIAKTFEILSNEEFNKIIFWSSSGHQFIIKDANRFQQIVLPKYFRHNKMNSFIRQLNMYGFHKSRKENSKSVFSHPSFLKGRHDLLITIKRKIKGKIFQNPILETPVKKRENDEADFPTATKQHSWSGLPNIPKTVNGQQWVHTTKMLESREMLFEKMNLNVSYNRLSQGEIAEQLLKFSAENDEEEDDNVSLAENMRQEELNDKKVNRESSYAFLNPSCFLDSFRK